MATSSINSFPILQSAEPAGGNSDDPKNAGQALLGKLGYEEGDTRALARKPGYRSSEELLRSVGAKNRAFERASSGNKKQPGLDEIPLARFLKERRQAAVNQDATSTKTKAAEQGNPNTRLAEAEMMVRVPGWYGTGKPRRAARAAGAAINPTTNVTIDLSEYVGHPEIPPVAHVAQKIYEQLGFNDEEARAYARASGYPDVAAAFYGGTADIQRAMESLKERASQDQFGGRVMIPETISGAIAAKRQWLAGYRAVQQRERDIQQIAMLDDQSQREHAAGAYALEHGSLKGEERDHLRLPGPEGSVGTSVQAALLGSFNPELYSDPGKVFGSVATDAGSMIRGAGVHFATPIITETGKIFGSKVTRNFGEWLARDSKSAKKYTGAAE